MTGADQWGNPSTASSTFTVDTTGPAIAISKPADGSTVTTHTPELDYTTGDAVAASVVVKVDGTTVEQGLRTTSSTPWPTARTPSP